MTEFDRLKIDYARLYGEFIGMIEGVLWWDIPEELKTKLKETKEQTIERCDKILKRDEK